MKKTTLLAALCLMSGMASAQDTYTNSQFVGTDLNGSARYVGMGGAMEALGADITTIGTNPAGTGLFRKSVVSLTGGFQMVGENPTEMDDANRTRFGFDQAGILFCTETGIDSYVNFGFNYRKSKNFNSLFSVEAGLGNNASQNKLSFDKYVDGVMNTGWDNESIIDAMYNESLIGGYNSSGKLVDPYNGYYNASKFRNQKVQRGYISDFDFNLSTNIRNQVYLGMTLGIRDVHYDNQSLYTEQLLGDDDRTAIGATETNDSRIITGTGWNLKFGAIVRPVETSPFRIGAYIHTPTFYTLTTSNYTMMYNSITDDEVRGGESYKFRMNTPWLFGVSLGHTIGRQLALGATYEYSDYSAMDNRYIAGNEYYVNSPSSKSDYNMNQNTKNSLKGIHTLKFGVEYKPISSVALRAGYNYVSPMFNDNAYRDMEIVSAGTYYATTFDYTNWAATNRYTFGVGFNFDDFNLDIAYQYRSTKGTFYPFHGQMYDNLETGEPDPFNNVAPGTSVKDDRHQVLLTLGYRF